MTIFGWDLSHYDGPDSRAAVGDLSFFTHKAGGDSDDTEITSWWALMKPYRYRAVLGAYWVLYPGNPVARADAFIARLDATCPGWRDGPFILQLDCEIWGGSKSTLPGLADIRACCDRLVARMPKLKPIVYAPKWAYQNQLSGLRYPLWASNYVGGSGAPRALYPGDGSNGWTAYSGQTPAILQFTSSATIAGQTTCDANAFRGTLQDLTALLAPGWAGSAPIAIDGDDMSAEDARDGFMLVLWDAAHAGRQDAAYAAAGASDQARMRQSRDLLKELLGGPVDQATLLVAIRSDSVDAAQLAATLAPMLHITVDGDVDPAAIQAAVEAGLRNVLGGLDNRAV